ncbi:hypothetical protein BC939DRAFT_434363 [Gamsiella multidivaricata]|uniref:uncharacterized protein n=1 Tax=Gamsiella multidivaricata TaxID=101098 RepID=UPI00222116ED|nr:uncharacterized protein BC939DRAFT_434363 [Gamsiella multidivaricata]KAG0353500.1 putative ATP-dependent RNA helicase ddx49 [Gamsiella multidivaricata]KAI7832781.1 hypothetical protein BC939DRAFT_434363 [Gamsiella multidivaricata]
MTSRQLSVFLLLVISVGLIIKASRGNSENCDPADHRCFTYRPDAKIAFITSYFKPSDDQRKAEIDVCLASLMANPVLEQVHVLVQSEDLPLPSFAVHNPKTHVSNVTKRPLMGDFIQYSCDHLLDHRVIFANSDIFFDSSLEYFTKKSDKVFDSTFYAISRWWLAKEGMTPHPYPAYGSYDTFAFKPRVLCTEKAKLQELVANLNYTLGILGAENRLLYEVKRLYPELKLENPVWTIRTVHIHQSQYRSGDWHNRVDEDGKSHRITSY